MRATQFHEFPDEFDSRPNASWIDSHGCPEMHQGSRAVAAAAGRNAELHRFLGGNLGSIMLACLDDLKGRGRVVDHLGVPHLTFPTWTDLSEPAPSPPTATPGAG